MVSGRLEAQPFLDRLRDQLAVGLQRGELVRMREQQIQQVSRGPVSGLQSGGQQQTQEGVNGFVAEFFAVDLGGDQVADDVLGGLGFALLDLLEEVILERRRCLEGAFVVDVVADQLHGALAEHRQVFVRQAQQSGR